MMKIIRYSICLQPLNNQHLELLRYWRNNPFINQHMEYKEYITENMQQEWFESIDNKYNFFFIIEHERKAVGLINTSKIDYEMGTAETGLFIWDEALLDSHVPVLASLCMLDVFFKIFGLKKVFAKIKNDNLKALNYNTSLGFQFSAPCPAHNFRLYELSAERYFSHASALINAAVKLYGNKTQINLDFQNVVHKEIFNLINKASEKSKEELNLLLNHN